MRSHGLIFVFKLETKNGHIDYVATNMENSTREQVKHIPDARYREIKQTCGIERCQSRTGRVQRNHIFMEVSAWFEQPKLRIIHKTTPYQQNLNMVKGAIQEQIKILMFHAA